METTYGPKGKMGNAVRVLLDSRTWKPSRPAQLSFDAKITKCSDPSRVHICGRALNFSEDEAGNWLVGAWDTFRVSGDVKLEMVTILDPSVNPCDFANAEGVTVEELT